MSKTAKNRRQYLLLGAAVVMACCQLFHAHYHAHGKWGGVPEARVMHADNAAPAIRLFASDFESGDDTGFCPICAGVFTSDVPPVAFSPLIPPIFDTASHFAPDAVPPLTPKFRLGRAPPSAHA